MNAFQAAGRRVAFRFGLTGRRWGDAGPVVLMMHDGDTTPWALAQLIEPLVAAGRQVIALDDPADARADAPARAREYASAALEAAVEMRNLESVVGHGLGAAAAARALSLGLPAEHSVLLSPDAATGVDEVLDSLLGRDPVLRLAA